MQALIIQLQDQVAAMGAAAPVAFACLYALCTVFLIPGSALTLAAGGLFGFRTGLIVSLAGANAGALASFLLARTLLRSRVETWAAAHPRFQAFDQAVRKHDFRMVVLARLSPVFPFVLLNYLTGLTAVRPRSLILANLLGMLPGAFLFVYLGTLGAAAASHSLSRWKLALQALGLIATAGIVWLVSRSARKSLTP